MFPIKSHKNRDKFSHVSIFQNVILELHTDVTLLRDGNTNKAMNIDIHHNSEKVNKSTKKCVAEDIAEYIHEELNIVKNRYVNI